VAMPAVRMCASRSVYRSKSYTGFSSLAMNVANKSHQNPVSTNRITTTQIYARLTT